MDFIKVYGYSKKKAWKKYSGNGNPGGAFPGPARRARQAHVARARMTHNLLKSP